MEKSAVGLVVSGKSHRSEQPVTSGPWRAAHRQVARGQAGSHSREIGGKAFLPPQFRGGFPRVTRGLQEEAPALAAARLRPNIEPNGISWSRLLANDVAKIKRTAGQPGFRGP